jgi:glycosyltransferase involved in cell wall biosynthesis
MIKNLCYKGVKIVKTITLPFFDYPEVSIILPTFNRARYLPACIESVLNQTFQDWELIVVDDGSNDATFDIVDPYIQQHAHIRYMKHQNRRPGPARNAGIQASFGNYITFIDSDDTYKANHLHSRLEYMQNHPDIDLIGGGVETQEDFWVTDYFDSTRLINVRDCIPGATFFGKRHVFFALQGFRDTYGEDAELWSRAAQVFRVQKLLEPETYVYTRSQDSITVNFQPTP